MSKFDDTVLAVATKCGVPKSAYGGRADLVKRQLHGL